jgi:hypothetical protein
MSATALFNLSAASGDDLSGGGGNGDSHGAQNTKLQQPFYPAMEARSAVKYL